MSNSLQHNNRSSQALGKRIEYIPYDNFYSNQGGGLDPRKSFSLLLKYKWVLLAFLIAGAVAAWFYADIVTPVYESSGTLLITSDNRNPADELSQIISQTTGMGTSSTLENELQILRSRNFSQQVAKKLIDDDSTDTNVESFPIYWKEADNGELVRASEGVIANRVMKNIQFYQPMEKADVVVIKYQSTSPKEASKVVNLAMQNYIDMSTEQNREAATSTADFLANEKERLKTNLQNAEQQLQNYMDATGIVSVNEQASNMVTQRASTEVELQGITLELQGVEKSIADYENQLDRISPGLKEQLTEAIGPRLEASQQMLAKYENERALIISKNPGVLQRDPLPSRIQFLDKELSRLKTEIQNLSANLFTSDNEFTGINSADRAQMVSNIQTKLIELQMQRNQLEARQKALTQVKNEMDADFEVLPRGMVQLAKLQRDVRINEELYINVSRQYADVAVLEQSKFGFGRVVDPANIPPAPVSPNKKIFLLLGLMLGGVMAAGFIFVREYRDNTVNNIGQLKTIYLPPLTVIPQIEQKSKEIKKSFSKGRGVIPKEIVMLNDRASMVSEAVRRLKNNIIFQNGEQPPKSIVITSPEKGDGKSTVSANLGIAFAEEKYWTLVIDADFRRPKLHKYFGLKNENGLSNYLNDQVPFDDLLKETDKQTLKLITAGRGAEMPEVLSNNHKFKQLLKKMEEVFDIIIIDTPPYGIISDSSALIKYAEATILVAKYQKTNKGMLLKTMEELKQMDANVTNIVLNNFNHRNEISNYYGDGYYQALYRNYDQYI